jgi:hypothetical protein
MFVGVFFFSTRMRGSTVGVLVRVEHRVKSGDKGKKHPIRTKVFWDVFLQ